MAMNQETELLEGLLARGLPDIDHPGYGTTALGVLAQIAVRTCKRGVRPDLEVHAALVPAFLMAWRRMRNGSDGYEEKVKLHDGSVVRMHGYNGFVMTKPSGSTLTMRVDRITGRLLKVTDRKLPTDEDHDTRVRAVTAHVRSRVEREMPDHLGEGDAVTIVPPRHARSPAAIEVTTSTGFKEKFTPGNARVRHDSDEDLIAYLEHDLDRLIAQQINFRYDAPAIAALQRQLDEIVTKSGLPIGMRIVAGSRTAQRAPVILDGYGDNGMAATREVARVNGKSSLGPTDMRSIEAAIKQQKRLHELHGPTPRVDLPGGWKVDSILDRHARRITGDQEVLRDIVKRGGGIDSRLPGVEVRLRGREVLGNVDLGSGARSMAGRIRIDGVALSMTVANSLRGQPLQGLVKHEDFPEDMLITRAVTFYSKHKTYLVAHTSRSFVPLVE